MRFLCDGVARKAIYAFDGTTLHVSMGDEQISTARHRTKSGRGAERDSESRMVAPMNGRIVSVLAKAGEAVKKGSASSFSKR